jgi:hypothetical protein
VLQTTFDEWQDYTQNDPRTGELRHLHMPGLGMGADGERRPGQPAVPDRPLHSHEFVGVDYDLEPGTTRAWAWATTPDQVLERARRLISRPRPCPPRSIRWTTRR